MKNQSQQGKGRLRVFFAEFEGNDQTIQEGLKAISTAVHRTFEAKPGIKSLLKAPTGDGPQIGDGPEIEEAQQDIQESDQPEADVSTPGSRQNSRSKPPTMSMVKDLNLRPEGKESFRDFFKSKAPEQQQEAIAVCVYYLQRMLGIEGITPNHIYTCFKEVGRRLPPNVPQAIRNTANRRAWVDSSKQTDIRLTTHGENLVEQDLPRKKDGDASKE